MLDKLKVMCEKPCLLLKLNQSFLAVVFHLKTSVDLCKL